MSVVSLTAALGISAVILGLAGCSSAGYYWQGFKGQMQIMQAAKPIDDWLTDDPAAAPVCRVECGGSAALQLDHASVVLSRHRLHCLPRLFR